MLTVVDTKVTLPNLLPVQNPVLQRDEVALNPVNGDSRRAGRIKVCLRSQWNSTPVEKYLASLYTL